MKKILIIIISILFSIQNNIGCNVQKIDSLFINHLESIEKTICEYTTSDTMKINISGDDRVFLEMLSFINTIHFEIQGYTHQPMMSSYELSKIKKWYQKNRENLNWHKMERILSGIRLNNNAYSLIKPHDDFSYKLYEQILDSLDIEFKNFGKENTFINNDTIVYEFSDQESLSSP
jgi:hypothetical protein